MPAPLQVRVGRGRCSSSQRLPEVASAGDAGAHRTAAVCWRRSFGRTGAEGASKCSAVE